MDMRVPMPLEGEKSAIFLGEERVSGFSFIKWILIAVSVFFCFATPPFQSPDEPYHFFKAYQISTGHMVSIPGAGGLGYPLPVSITELSEKTFPLPPESNRFNYKISDVMDSLQQDGQYDRLTFAKFTNAAPYSPTMYIPQAVGIFFGRQLDLPPIALLYLGRIANALTGILLIIAAINCLPGGKAIMVAVAAMPMTLFQMGSLSPDATIIGLGFMAVALSMRAVLKYSMGTWELFSLPAVVISLALAKGVYLPLAFAGLAIKRDCFSKRNIVLVGSVIAGCILFFAWTIYGGHSGEIETTVISRKTMLREVVAKPGAQLALILDAPLQFLYVLLSSFAERLPVYIVGIIGRFGWNTILLPIPVYLLAIAVILLAAIDSSASLPRYTHGRRLWWLLIVIGLTALIETALYLSATPLGADYIQGTQGRYFTPFLPLLGFAVLPCFPWIKARFPYLRTLLPCLISILVVSSLVVAINSFWSIGMR